MKTQQNIRGMLVLMAALVGSSLIAEPGFHRPGRPGPGPGQGGGHQGTVREALADAQRLESAIRMSWLGRDAVRAAADYVRDMERLYDCAQNFYRRDPRGFAVDREVPAGCARELQDARYEFSDVQAELAGAPLNPRLRMELNRAAASLRALRLGTGGHGPRPGRMIECVAVDQGHEEHFGGHKGFGETTMRAERSAMRACLAVHGRCEIRSCRTTR
jgi:hypothetical protein